MVCRENFDLKTLILIFRRSAASFISLSTRKKDFSVSSFLDLVRTRRSRFCARKLTDFFFNFEVIIETNAVLFIHYCQKKPKITFNELITDRQRMRLL